MKSGSIMFLSTECYDQSILRNAGKRLSFCAKYLKIWDACKKIPSKEGECNAYGLALRHLVFTARFSFVKVTTVKIMGILPETNFHTPINQSIYESHF